MKKFRVVYAIDYVVEAEDENDATDKTGDLFNKEIRNLHSGLTEIFDCDVSEVE